MVRVVGDALIEACLSMKDRLTGLANAAGCYWSDWPGSVAVDAALRLALVPPQLDDLRRAAVARSQCLLDGHRGWGARPCRSAGRSG